MYMQRTTSGAAGNGLHTTIKYMRGASGIGMGTTIKHLRRTTSGAAGNGLGATMKYLLRTTSAAANNGMSTTITPPCSAASFEINSEPHTGARPSFRLCVGPELARCVHTLGEFWVPEIHGGKRQMNIILLIDTTIEGASPSHARKE